MKKATLLFAVLLIAQLCSAQTNWIKGGISYGPERSYHFVNPDQNKNGSVFQSDWDLAPKFSLSFLHFTTNNRFWEFGVEGVPGTYVDQYRTFTPPILPGGPEFEKIGKSRSRSIALMIERGRNFNPECGGTRSIYGAWFVSPFYNAHNFKDALTSDSQFGQNLKNGGLTFGVSPRLYSFVGKRLLVELSMRLNMVSMAYTYNRIENPALSSKQQKSNTFDVDSFNGMSFRLAVGLRTDGNKEK
jgi:hypothetical protein